MTRGSWAWPFLTARAIATSLNAVLLIVLAQLAPVEAFGALITATATLIAVGVLFDLGASGLVIRIRSENPRSPLIRALVRLNTRTNVCLFLATLAVVAVLAGSSESWRLFVLLSPLAIAIPVEKTTQFLTQIHLADGRLTWCGINLVGQRIVHLVVFLTLNAFTNDPASFSVAYAIAALAGRWHLASGAIEATAGSVPLRQAITSGLPFLGNSAGGHLRNFDLLVVSVVGGTVAAGTYGLPARLGAVALFFPTAVAPLIISRLARGERFSIGLAFRSRWLILPLACAAVAFVLMGTYVTSLVASDKYAGAQTIALFYFSGLVPLVLSTIGIAVLLGIGQERFLAFSSLGFNVLLLVAIAVGTQAAAGPGAALSFAVVQALQFFFILLRLLSVRQTRQVGAESEIIAP